VGRRAEDRDGVTRGGHATASAALEARRQRKTLVSGGDERCAASDVTRSATGGVWWGRADEAWIGAFRDGGVDLSSRSNTPHQWRSHRENHSDSEAAGFTLFRCRKEKRFFPKIKRLMVAVGRSGVVGALLLVIGWE